MAWNNYLSTSFIIIAFMINGIFSKTNTHPTKTTTTTEATSSMFNGSITSTTLNDSTSSNHSANNETLNGTEEYIHIVGGDMNLTFWEAMNVIWTYHYDHVRPLVFGSLWTLLALYWIIAIITIACMFGFCYPRGRKELRQPSTTTAAAAAPINNKNKSKAPLPLADVTKKDGDASKKNLNVSTKNGDASKKKNCNASKENHIGSKENNGSSKKKTKAGFFTDA